MDIQTEQKLKQSFNSVGLYTLTVALLLYGISFLLAQITLISGTELNNPYISPLISMTASIGSMFVSGLLYCLISGKRLQNLVPAKAVEP